MDFGVDDILVLKATYKASTRRLTMRKSHDLTVALLEKHLIELFRISEEDLARASVRISGVSGNGVSGVAGGAAGGGGGMQTPTSGTTPSSASAAAGGGTARGNTPGASKGSTPTRTGGSVFSGVSHLRPQSPLTTVFSSSSTSASVLMLTYTDVEGDIIGLVEDRDLKDALFFQRLNPLRLTVVLPGDEDSDAEDDDEVVEGGSRKPGRSKAKKGEELKEKVEQAGKGKWAKLEGEEEKTLQVYFRAVGMELRETCKATEETLELTMRKITDMVQSAISNLSSLHLEVRFDGVSGAAGGSAPGPVMNGNAAEVPLGLRESQGFLSPPPQQQPPQQQQQPQQQPQQQTPPPPQTQGPVQTQAAAQLPSLTGNPSFGVTGLLPTSSQTARSAADGDAAHVIESSAAPVTQSISGMFSNVAAPIPALRAGGMVHSNSGGSLGMASAPSGCAVCKMSPILGARYQSVHKPEYELCFACFSAHGLEGNFQKVASDAFAKPRPAAIPARGYGGGVSALGTGVSTLLYPGEVSGGLDRGLGDGDVTSIAAIHEGIECDLCRMCPIRGPRYKSNVQQDFDLCQNCYSRELNKHHYDEILSPMEPSPRR